MSVTRKDFIDAVVAAGEFKNPNASLALLTLSVNEYGDTSDFGAKFNLFDTTLTMPGDSDYNYNGGYPVKNYPDLETGVKATLETLDAGRYDNAVAMLKNPNYALSVNNSQQILHEISADGWGSINLSLVAIVSSDEARYQGLIVSGGANVNPPAPPAPVLARTTTVRANLLGRVVWNTSLDWAKFDSVSVHGQGAKIHAYGIDAGGHVRIRVNNAKRDSWMTIHVYAKGS